MMNEGGDSGQRASSEDRTAADMILEKKYQGRLERLAALNETRLQESSARKSIMAAGLDPRESVDVFLASFSQKREDAEVGLAMARTKQIQPPFSVKEHLVKLSLSVTAMDKLIADSAYFLPASVVKASHITIAKLLEELETANAELLPKKKFSFHNKAKNPSPQATVATTLAASKMATCSVTHGEEATVASEPKSDSGNAGNESSQSAEVNNVERIEGKSNATFVRDARELGGELTLSNLTKCRVCLRGRLTTLIVHSLKNCHIYSGPVTGSVFIEDVKSSMLVVASHQIRIHSTSSTDFYLRVRSRPVVEYASKVRFAPYAFVYGGIEEDLVASNLQEETGLWEKVDDFRWLRAVHSPNWSVLPAEERIPVEDGSNVMGVGCES